jgi:hypothetical protein
VVRRESSSKALTPQCFPSPPKVTVIDKTTASL